MPRYEIMTPEQVRFHYETAGLMSRAMAWTVDQLFLWVCRFGIAYFFLRTGLLVGWTMFLLGIFALDFGYYMAFEYWWAGQSPGKRIFKIRVISAQGGRLLYPQIFMRNLMRPLDTLPFAMLLGGIVAWADRLRRRLGDFVGETLVVRDARLAVPEAELDQRSRANTYQADPVIRNRILTRVTRGERDLLLDLVLRRDELAPTVREELFHQAAAHCRWRYSLPEDQEYLSDEQTVVNIALVLQKLKFT